MLGKLAKNKRVPSIIFESNNEGIVNFLGAYWDCDGWFCSLKTGNLEVGIISTSKGLIYDTQHLLLRLGILSRVKYKKVKYQEGYKDAWGLYIYDAENIIKFIESIPLKGKREKALEVYKKAKERKYKVTNIKDVVFDEIISIEYIGDEETYDLNVPETHTIISDDIISHNTEAMCIEMLHAIFTVPGIEVMVVAPYKNQVQLIFDRLNNYIDRSEELKGKVKRRANNPHIIQTKENAYIRGFTSGVKSGNKADSLRGQGADKIYLDEVDYMSQGDIESIIVILSEKKTTTLWASSTPTGKRQHFWSWCFQEGTLISTPDGVKNIEDIKQGDPIISIDGKIGEAKNTFSRDVEEGVFYIDTHHIRSQPLGSITYTTGEHPYYTKRGWVEAKNLILDDYIKVPIQMEFSQKYPDVRDVVGYQFINPVKQNVISLWKQHRCTLSYGELGRKAGISKQYATTIAKQYKEFNDLAVYDPRVASSLSKADKVMRSNLINTCEFNELAGLYLAEGHVLYTDNKYITGIQLTFSKKEQDLVDKVVNLFARLFSVEVKVVAKDIDNTLNVLIYKSWIGILFKSLFGEYSHEKCIPEVMLHNSSIQCLLILVQNFMYGDGHNKKSGNWVTTITSQKLALQLHNIYLRGGIPSSFHANKIREGKKPTFNVSTLSEMEGQTWKFFNGEFYVKVKGVKTKHYKGKVYNMDTTGVANNTYVANLLAVHNCHSPMFKEFHFASTCSPNWGPGMESEMIEHYQGKNSPGFLHEVMAEFGEEAEGVFSNAKINDSLKNYEYYDYDDVEENYHDFKYCIGIDWNKAAKGSHFVVVEWSRETNRFKVVDHIVIHATEFNDIAAMDEVIRLNDMYDPEFIYCDEGYGDTKIELLHKYGMENPETGLHEKFKPINFSSKKVILDPWTKQESKKDIKPYIINIARNFLDQDRCILPKHEDIKNDDDFGCGLVATMRDYAVIKTNLHGRPVYTEENDHALVSWMLALFAFHEELADTFSVNWTSEIGIVGHFGKPDVEEDARAEEDEGFYRVSSFSNRNNEYRRSGVVTYAESRDSFNFKKERPYGQKRIGLGSRSVGAVGRKMF